MKKIYLASPWFNEHEKDMYFRFIKKMREDGNEVYAPVEHEIPNAWDISNKVWGTSVFNEDISAINTCDEVWVLNFGMYSDSGTAWECGYAYGIGKPVRMFVDDWNEKIYSLMMVNGCTNVESMLNYLKEGNSPLEIEVK
jgi:nucleoside 2-deoxyribosyltransferase